MHDRANRPAEYGHRETDRQAALRMGCSSARVDTHPDDSPFAQIAPWPWPEVEADRYGTASACPVDGAPLLPNGCTDVLACGWCGLRLVPPVLGYDDEVLP